MFKQNQNYVGRCLVFIDGRFFSDLVIAYHSRSKCYIFDNLLHYIKTWNQLVLTKTEKNLMKLWMKIAAGMLGGLTIIASLGGFKTKNDKQDNTQDSPKYEADEIPDSILDGDMEAVRKVQEARGNKQNQLRRETEQNVRSLQEGFTRASNIIGNLSIIFNSVLKIFYDDPVVRVTPTTIIYR